MANFLNKIFSKSIEKGNIQNPLPFFLSLKNRADYIYEIETDSDIYNAIFACPVVSSIVNSQVNYITNGKLEVLTVNDTNYVKGTNTEYYRLLESPNPIQSFEQLLGQISFYVRTFGYCVVYTPKRVGYVARSIWVLPPHKTNIRFKLDNDMFKMKVLSNYIESIELNESGKSLPIDKDSVFIITDNTIPIKNIMLPESRIKLLANPIKNIIANYGASYELMVNRGSRGILSNTNGGDTKLRPMTKQQKEELQREYREKYGIMPEQAQIMITDASLNYLNMGYNVSELGLNESHQRDIEDIAFGFNHPLPLIKASGTTYSNVESSERRLYQSVIIPLANSIAAQLEIGLGYRAKGIKIQIDYSHVGALQESELMKGRALGAMATAVNALFDANAITYNRRLELLGEDTVDGMDRYKYELNFYDNGNKEQTN